MRYGHQMYICAGCDAIRCTAALVILAVIVVAGGVACDETKAQKSAAQTRPVTLPSVAAPLSKQSPAANDAPLLLDDAPAAKVEGQADNSRCQVCHLNLVTEELAVKHAKAKIGCAGCHGACDEHIADESWTSGGNGTAPDKMYPPDKINRMCSECHPRDKIDYTLHRTFLEGVSDEKFCVNCHGKHKLPVRKCKWK